MLIERSELFRFGGNRGGGDAALTQQSCFGGTWLLLQISKEREPIGIKFGEEGEEEQAKEEDGKKGRRKDLQIVSRPRPLLLLLQSGQARQAIRRTCVCQGTLRYVEAR